MKKMYIFVGKGKDESGVCRRELTGVINRCGGKCVDRVEEADVIAVLGGDGTIMRAAHLAGNHNLPMIGINLGRVGYMAELDWSEIGLLRGYFDGNYREEERMMLAVNIEGKSYYALNDAVFHAKNKHMTQIMLKCNGNTVNEYRGDGLIIATPTGSTAYSMSGGGSVIDPRLRCICVTPICPQALGAKPLVFAPDSKLSLTAESQECMLTVDGGEAQALRSGTEAKVFRSRRSLRMIRLKEDGFYEVLRKKSQM